MNTEDPHTDESDAEVIDSAKSDLFPDGFDPEWMGGMIACRKLHGDDEGLWLSLIPLTFARSRICVCEGSLTGNASVEHWCMSSILDGLIGWLEFPGTPIGWNRHQRRDGTMEWPDHDRWREPDETTGEASG